MAMLCPLHHDLSSWHMVPLLLVAGVGLATVAGQGPVGLLSP